MQAYHDNIMVILIRERSGNLETASPDDVKHLSEQQQTLGSFLKRLLSNIFRYGDLSSVIGGILPSYYSVNNI
jgi:hypothetical protein